MKSALELLKIHIETLFTHTTEGRLLRINEPNGRPAPRFLLGRTTEGNLFRFHNDLPHHLVQELSILAKTEPVSQSLEQSPRHTNDYEKLLAEQSPIQKRWEGPGYLIPLPQLVEPNVIELTRGNIQLLHHDFGWLEESLEEEQPCWGVVADGRIVSICRSVRIGEEAHEAGVETVEGYRGRGFAAAAVRGWATAVHQMGLIPMYSTSWENKASQRVAEKLGMIFYGATYYLT